MESYGESWEVFSGVEEIVWLFKWHDAPECAIVKTDSDWGGASKDRKSTSGGGWQMGEHCINTWCATQGAYTLSSAEAEL